MGLLKPESLIWADQIENLKGQTPVERRSELKKAYDLSTSHITNLLTIKACFDQAAFDKVREAAESPNPYILSFSSAQALSGLKNKVKPEDLNGSVHVALDIIFSHRLDTRHIKSLVDWMIGGKPASEFDPKAKPPKRDPLIGGSGSQKGKTEKGKGDGQTGETDELDLDKLGQLLEKAKVEKAGGDGQTKDREKLEKYLGKIYLSPSQLKDSVVSGKDFSFSETMMLDWLSDIPVIAQIKSKVKKGKPVTKGEVVLLWLHKAGEITGRLVKRILKLFKPFFKIIHWVWKLMIDVLKEVGLYKYAKALFVFAALFTVCWFVWETFNYGFMRPVEFIWSKIAGSHYLEPAQSRPVSQLEASTEMSSPTPAVSTLVPPVDRAMVHLKPKPTVIPTYRPSIAFKMTDFDPKLLEQEIAAIPANSVIKNYVFQPDEGMPADLAVSRLQDLTDADKYTMMIGSGKQKILSVTPSNTNFIITYKSTDPLGLFGNSSGTMNIFLEDIQYIHINEIDCSSPRSGTQQPNIIYQCSLVVSGAKNPLTIQCASAEDLGHLVSTLEYFIRQSRLGHDAQPGGMPYPSQGVKLNNNHVVTLLWAKSPMDLAGVGLGDHFWSVGKITSVQQSLKDLEEGIQTLPATFFVVSPAEWEKAQTAAQKPGSDSSIHPKLRKVYLGH